jgi:hypothetical protein
VNVVIGVVLLVVAVWIAIFGGVGALLSRSRGGSSIAGLAWGTALGPIGWLATLWLTRSLTRPVQAAARGGRLEPGPEQTGRDPWDE